MRPLQLNPLEVVDHRGRRRTLWPESSSTAVGALANAIGVDPRRGVAVDGVVIDPAVPASAAGIARGSRLTAAERITRPDADAPTVTGSSPLVTATVVAGPAVGAGVSLTEGRHVIGRSLHAGVRVDDPEVEPHHVLLEVTGAGSVTLTQLTGRVPIRIAGVPAQGRVASGVPVVTEVGSSSVLLQGVADAVIRPLRTGDVPGDPWRRMVLRQPRVRTGAELPTIEVPAGVEERSAGGAGTGVVAPLVGVVGAFVLAAVVGQPMLAAFAALGAVATLSTWATMRWRGGRELRRARRRYAEESQRFAAAAVEAGRALRVHHLATVTTASDVEARSARSDLWARRAAHGDAFTVSLGVGEVRRRLPLSPPAQPVTLSAELGTAVDRAELLTEVPFDVALDARDRFVVTVVGRGGDAVVRAVAAQLAVQTGPADWQLLVVTDDPARYPWVDWLPHAARPADASAIVEAADRDGVAAALGRLDREDDRRVVVVTDQPSLLSTPTSPLRRLLEGRRAVTVLLVLADRAAVPAMCAATLEIGPRWAGRWTADLDAEGTITLPARLHVAGVSLAAMERISHRLARYVDPEAGQAGSLLLPRELRLSDVCPLPMEPGDVVAMWQAAGIDPPPAAPVGASAHGVLELDLVRDGPHALVAGTTGSGKSELLRTMVVSLAARVSPQHVTFVLIDYKGGATFDACAELPHTVGVVTDLDAGLATRALRSLEAELRRRERLLRAHGAVDVTAYRAVAGDGAPRLPRLVVVVDEFAALAAELPQFLAALVGIAQRGRSLGLHLVLATQRPAGVVDDAIRANTQLRLALRLHDRRDAIDVVGDELPASLPKDAPGRAVARLGPGELVEFQTAQVTAEVPGTGGTELAVLVDAIRRAAAAAGLDEPFRPWLPPLPAIVSGELGPGELGIVDDPGAQCRRPLTRGGGNLALVGARRSGTTTALLAIASRSSADSHLYVLDARGDVAFDVLDQLPRCAGVVRLHERERVDRMLAMLRAELDRRLSSPGLRSRPVLVLVDGLTAVRSTLDAIDRVATASALDRVLTEGPGVGITTVAVIDPAGAVTGSVVGRFAQRWVFHLDDAADGPALGVPVSDVPPPIPGRVVVTGQGLAAQIALPLDGGAGGPGDEGVPARISVLPERVDAADLEPAPPGRALVGVCFERLQPVSLAIGPSDRLLVAGPPRSGRSSFLEHVVRWWRGAHPGAPLTVVCGSSLSPLAADPATVTADCLDAVRWPHLVVVDDAECVDDVAGQLTAMVAMAGEGPAVVVAGRADALRMAYGHWTAPLRRSRAGFVMAASAETDGDLLGVVLPRRCPITPRPGLAWMAEGGAVSLVQLVAG